MYGRHIHTHSMCKTYHHFNSQHPTNIRYIKYTIHPLSRCGPFSSSPLRALRHLTHIMIHARPIAFLFFGIQKIYTDLCSFYLSVSIFDSLFHSHTHTHTGRAGLIALLPRSIQEITQQVQGRDICRGCSRRCSLQGQILWHCHLRLPLSRTAAGVLQCVLHFSQRQIVLHLHMHLPLPPSAACCSVYCSVL